MLPFRIEQLSQQFWVEKEQIASSNYDLSASRYREAMLEETYREMPEITLERLQQINNLIEVEIESLRRMIVE